MLNTTTLIIEAVTNRLGAQFRYVFGPADPKHQLAIATAVRLVLERTSLSDALYHDVEHTVMVTLLGTEILRGREIAGRVTAEDWLHMTVALLCHDVGYVRGACRGDTATEAVINAGGRDRCLAARCFGRLAHAAIMSSAARSSSTSGPRSSAASTPTESRRPSR